jgi:serine/threonine-protein kinase HipA
LNFKALRAANRDLILSMMEFITDPLSITWRTAKVGASEPLSALEARIIAGGDSSLGGAKPKALINIEGAQWVIKFFNNESVDAPLVEHATMTLTALAGISGAATQVVRLSGLHAVAIQRFDRKLGGGRIHSVSAGTTIRAATAAGQEPQLSYPELARLLRRAGVATQVRHLRSVKY